MKDLSGYRRNILHRIGCELARGRTLESICGRAGVPALATLRRWARGDPEGFGAALRRFDSRGRGRPTRLTADLAAEICRRLAEGRSLHAVCGDADMPDDRTVWQWVAQDRDGFGAHYRRARELGYLTLVDEVLEIVDDSRGDWRAERGAGGEVRAVLDRANIAQARLAARTRCWLLAVALPKHGTPPEDGAPDLGLRALMRAIDGMTRGLPKDDRRPIGEWRGR